MNLLKQNYAKGLARLRREDAMGGYKNFIGPDHKFTAVCSYYTSTLNRRLFSMAIIDNTYSGQATVPSRLARLLSVSRNTMDAMIAEGEASGWVDVERDQNNQRRVEASPFLLESWLHYADWARSHEDSLGLMGIYQAIHAVEVSAKIAAERAGDLDD
tara:strand:- start:2643 stop:3116 length:474 start_codon:yes stop_codon:yes gene_type:complete